MRGFFLFLVMITIVMLGLAGCPAKEGGSGTAKSVSPTSGGAAGGGTTGGESTTDGGE